ACYLAPSRAGAKAAVRCLSALIQQEALRRDAKANRASGVLLLQDVERLVELIVRMRFWLLLAFFRSQILIEIGCHQHIRCHRLILNLLAGWRFILCDGEDQSRAIRHFDGLLHRAFAKGAVADNVTALIVQDGSSYQLARTGCS